MNRKAKGSENKHTLSHSVSPPEALVRSGAEPQPRIIMKKVTDHADYYIVERNASPEDLINREISRAHRNRRRGGPPKTRKPPDRSREREYELEKALRRVRVLDGLCTNCGSDKLVGGFRMCLSCRLRWRTYNARCAARKILSLTGYSFDLSRIDREGASIDF